METLWATANVRTGREAEIAALLTQRGREVYYPRVTEWRRPRWKRKAMAVQSPAMPGYLFIDQDTIGNSEELYAMENFHYFVRTKDEGRLWLLTGKQLDWIRENMEREDKPTDKGLRSFRLQDKVKVIPEGPFGSMRGVVIGVGRRSVWVGGGDFSKPVDMPGHLLELNIDVY